jgi:hypothetical protein
MIFAGEGFKRRWRGLSKGKMVVDGGFNGWTCFLWGVGLVVGWG